MKGPVLKFDDERRAAFLALFVGDKGALSTIPSLFYHEAARRLTEDGPTLYGLVGQEINSRVALAQDGLGRYGGDFGNLAKWERWRDIVRDNPRICWAFAEYAIERGRDGAIVERAAPERDSHLEDLFARTWDALDRPRLAYALVAQHRVGVYWIDFAIVEPRIAVEIDGHDFHSSPDARRHDAAKGRYLVMLGWAVFRFTGHEVANHAEDCCRELYRLAVRRTAFDQPYEAIVPRGGRL